MAKLTEVEFLKEVIKALQEALKRHPSELPDNVKKVNYYIQGRIDSLPE